MEHNMHFHTAVASGVSEHQVICISAVTILLDRPIGYPVFIKLLFDENEISQQHFSGKDQELRWVLDPAQYLHSGSRLVVQLCEPSFFWWPKIAVEAAIASRDILHLYTSLTTYQEIQLMSTPVITIEVIDTASHQKILEGARRMLKACKNALDNLEKVRTFVGTLQGSGAIVSELYPNVNSILIAVDAIRNHLNQRALCDLVISELVGDMAAVVGCIEQNGQGAPFSKIIWAVETVLPLVEAARVLILNHSSDSSSVSVEINNLQQKFGEIKVQIIYGVTAPATMELVEDSITTDIPSIDKPSATKTNKSTTRPNTGTKQTESPEQTKPMEQPACSTERPAHVAGQSTNVTVTKAIADALDVFKSSLAPGIGISLRRIRLERTSKLFRQLEFRCNLQQLSQVKMQLLMTQCEAIKLFPYTDMNKGDAKNLLSQVDEVLSVWAWQHLHHRAGFLDNDIFRDLQLQLSKSTITSDPLILSLRIEAGHAALEDTLHQAIRHFEAGRWALAMSLLKSQDALIDVLVDVEDAYQNAAAVDSSWTPLEPFESGKANLTRVEFDMQLAMCRASQLIHTGDMHFREAETGVAEDMMGHAQLAQDDYRVALFCVTGQDIELEGNALSRLARFYSKIAKLPVPAHQLYLRAVQLAASLSPALPKGNWYTESVAAVQKHRDELQAQEANEWAAKREPILQKLSVDIEKLRSSKTMTDREFCEFVFKEWPPKTEGAPEPPRDPLDPCGLSKKHLLKVIQRYHTDRNSQSGEDWIVLCEEISKELTNRYNTLKEVD